MSDEPDDRIEYPEPIEALEEERRRIEYGGPRVECVKYDVEQPPMFRYDPGTDTAVKMDEPTLSPLYEISEHALGELELSVQGFIDAGGMEQSVSRELEKSLGYIRAARENGPILLPRDPEFAEVDEPADTGFVIGDAPFDMAEDELVEQIEGDGPSDANPFGRLYADAARSHMEAEQRLAEMEHERANLQHEAATAAQQRDFLSRQVDSLVQRVAAAYVGQGLIDMAAAQGFVQKEILPINQVLAQIAASQQERADG